MNAFERRPEFTWFFIYFFYLLAVYLARALSQQKETKNSSDGKSHQLLLICITVWCKRRKKGLLLSELQDDRLDYLFIDDRMLIWEMLPGSELGSNLWQLMDVCYFQQVYDSTGQNELYLAGFFKILYLLFIFLARIADHNVSFWGYRRNQFIFLLSLTCRKGYTVFFSL